MEAPEDDVMIESEFDLDDLVEENFELRDPGCSKSRLHKKMTQHPGASKSMYECHIIVIFAPCFMHCSSY